MPQRVRRELPVFGFRYRKQSPARQIADRRILDHGPTKRAHLGVSCRERDGANNHILQTGDLPQLPPILPYRAAGSFNPQAGFPAAGERLIKNIKYSDR
jgi:hypothetical protein